MNGMEEPQFGCMAGIPNDKIDWFFQQMFLSDITMPHTHKFLSPITFSQFLDRNQIRTFNPLAIYDEANDRWRKFILFNPDALTLGPRGNNDLELAERESKDAWHPLIDYFKRILLVDKMPDIYMKMHYLSHVCREFLGETAKIGDVRETACTRAIFTQMIGPILYDSIIPAQYCFLPVRHHTDANFTTGIELAKRKIDGYITGHTAQHMQIEKLDELRSAMLKKDLHAALKTISKNKDDLQTVRTAMVHLANNMKIYRIDQDAYEMSDVMYRDKLVCARVVVELEHLGDQYIKAQCMTSADTLIDRLLEVWSILSPPKKKTFGSRIKRAIKKKKPAAEDMENDVEAIKRESKPDPS